MKKKKKQWSFIHWNDEPNEEVSIPIVPKKVRELIQQHTEYQRG